MIQTINLLAPSKSSDATNQQTVPEGFAALMQGKSAVETAVTAPEIANAESELVAGELIDGAAERATETPGPPAQMPSPAPLLKDGETVVPAVSAKVGLPDAQTFERRGFAVPDQFADAGKVQQPDAAPQTLVGTDSNKQSQNLVNSTPVIATDTKLTHQTVPPVQTGPQPVPVAITSAPMVQSALPEPAFAQASTQPQIAVDTTDIAKRQVTVAAAGQPQSPAPITPVSQVGQDSAAPLSLPSDKPTPPIRTPEMPTAQAPQTVAKDALQLTTPNPAQDIAKPTVQVQLSQGQLQVLGPEQQTIAAQGMPAIQTAQGVAKPSLIKQGELSQIDHAAPDGRAADRPSMMGAVFATGKATLPNAPLKPANQGTVPLDLDHPEHLPPAPALSSTTASTEAGQAMSAAETVAKPAAKPFSEALMAQVKSVEVAQGRTTVNLIPRGLGSIEIEVLSESDVTQKVVVRVENPAVLQALRDDRQGLAQAIGVSDSSIFDFQEQAAGDHPSQRQHNSNQGGIALSDGPLAQPEPKHLDVVQDGQLDILT
ncbi:flagellar hook-length control protein FliK [Sulfitobacter geojensis]|uniref:flagellar hook-length control protein FliK n=1 Tax=Sulfitobacter geojensis TaxID=1342299 RepID=UPI000469BD39|nr:flagellar hook-length control protein FliK [Sulfitobacter geojensis]KHA50206.1 Flagellar hook-length control protein FliK [Sulfitobacter geojensis]NYI27402.1 hypothetical protein [Sulfitobacter geojensis]